MTSPDATSSDTSTKAPSDGGELPVSRIVASTEASPGPDSTAPVAAESWLREPSAVASAGAQAGHAASEPEEESSDDDEHEAASSSKANDTRRLRMPFGCRTANESSTQNGPSGRHRARKRFIGPRKRSVARRTAFLGAKDRSAVARDASARPSERSGRASARSARARDRSGRRASASIASMNPSEPSADRFTGARDASVERRRAVLPHASPFSRREAKSSRQGRSSFGEGLCSKGRRTHATDEELHASRRRTQPSPARTRASLARPFPSAKL